METREGAGDRERERGCKAERKGGWLKKSRRERECVCERERKKKGKVEEG